MSSWNFETLQWYRAPNGPMAGHLPPDWEVHFIRSQRHPGSFWQTPPGAIVATRRRGIEHDVYQLRHASGEFDVFVVQTKQRGIVLKAIVECWAPDEERKVLETAMRTGDPVLFSKD
jgi:hypothetical protein